MNRPVFQIAHASRRIILQSSRRSCFRPQSAHQLVTLSTSSLSPKLNNGILSLAITNGQRKHQHGQYQNNYITPWGYLSSLFLLSGTALLTFSASTTSQCKTRTSISVSHVGTPVVIEPMSEEDLPIFTLADVSKNDGRNGRPIWMTYGGMVYDVTDFIPNHPGGSEKIMEAAGGSIERFWNVYRQHYSTDLPMQMMEKMVIGRLYEKEQEEIDEMMEMEMENDPYDREPKRSPLFNVHGDQPMNAEVPTSVLGQSYHTPNDLFYIRHHHPVPYLKTKDVLDYRLNLFNSGTSGPATLQLSLTDLQSLPQHDVTATLQCGGNRRGEYNAKARTSGTAWGQGAISNAVWTGPRLRDVLMMAGVTEEVAAKEGLCHVIFTSLDGMRSSIPFRKAIDYYGDTILALKMNGDVLPRDHGFPVRVIVPGYNAVRSVKWVSSIVLSDEEASGPWQRGLNYKVLPPSVTNANSVNLDEISTMMEASLFSGITGIQLMSGHETAKAEARKSKGKKKMKAGDRVFVAASGWAWAGGGRNIARVDVTGDGGENWTTARVIKGGDQKYQQAWAWVFWTCEGIPAVVGKDGTVEIASKAVDISGNVQPESSDHMWNVRGLANNSWYRMNLFVG